MKIKNGNKKTETNDKWNKIYNIKSKIRNIGEIEEYIQ